MAENITSIIKSECMTRFIFLLLTALVVFFNDYKSTSILNVVVYAGLAQNLKLAHQTINYDQHSIFRPSQYKVDLYAIVMSGKVTRILSVSSSCR